MIKSSQISAYFFLLVFLTFAIGMLATSLVLEYRARRAVEPFEQPFEFVNIPTMPQHPGVTDHDYWVKRNRGGV